MADNTITIKHEINGSSSGGGGSNGVNVDINQILRQQHSLLQTLQSVASKLEKTIKPKMEKKTAEEKDAEVFEKAQKKRNEVLAKQQDNNLKQQIKAQDKQNKEEEKKTQNEIKLNSKLYDLELKNIQKDAELIRNREIRDRQEQQAFEKTRNANLNKFMAGNYISWWENVLNQQDAMSDSNSAFRSSIPKNESNKGWNWQYKTRIPTVNEPTPPSTLPLSIASVLGASLAQYVGRELDISSRYRMGQAQELGSFAQAGVMGRSFDYYPQFRANLIQQKKQEQMAQNSSNWGWLSNGLRYGADALVGIGAGLLTKSKTIGLLAGNSTDRVIGNLTDKVGDYFAGKQNAKIAPQYDYLSAEEQKNAMLRNAFWQSPLASYGGGSSRFMKSYGNSQMALPITQGILPFMNQDYKGMDLEKVSKNFLQAGYSVDQFSKLTLQATQYQVVTGKNLQAFSQDMMEMRAKYRGAYDLNTNQTAIDLMTKGIKPEEAQKIAYQSQFNPAMLQGINNYLGNDRVSFENKKALGKNLGIDFLSIEQDPSNAKKYMSPKMWKQFNEELKNFNSTDPKKRQYGNLMTMINKGTGWNSTFMEELRTGAPEGIQGTLPKESTESTPNEAMTSADNVLQAIQAGLSSLSTLNVQSATVNVYGNVNNKSGGGSGGSPIASIPFPF
jgi:hypothetical protein